MLTMEMLAKVKQMEISQEIERIQLNANVRKSKQRRLPSLFKRKHNSKPIQPSCTC